MGSIFYIYFDLRKYSFIDRNFNSVEQFKLLSEMHQIIESGMVQINGNLYHLSIDTALYFVQPEESIRIFKSLQRIKKDVDDYFTSKQIPSMLHIACVYGDSSEGNIELRNRKFFNILGEVNSSLQRIIYAVESPEGEILFDKICFDESATKELGFRESINSISVSEHTYYYIPENRKL